MRVLFCLAGVLAWLAWTGCTTRKAAPVRTPAPSGDVRVPTNAPSSESRLIVTPEEGLEGKITWVNANLRFVVITFPLDQMPAVGRRLNVYRDGLKVGEVKISGPQSDDSIVADVVAGEVVAGNEVRDR